jgi:hypothetical protein
VAVRGVREIPISVDSELRGFLQDLQEQVKSLRGPQTPLPQPSNFKVTSMAFGALLQWTRSVGADYYDVLWNSAPTASTANRVNVGSSAQWFDSIGQVGITRFYWVQPRRFLGAGGPLTPGLQAVTLASNVGTAPPTPPPPSKILVLDQQTGHILPYTYAGRAGDRTL